MCSLKIKYGGNRTLSWNSLRKIFLFSQNTVVFCNLPFLKNLKITLTSNHHIRHCQSNYRCDWHWVSLNWYKGLWGNGDFISNIPPLPQNLKHLPVLLLAYQTVWTSYVDNDALSWVTHRGRIRSTASGTESVSNGITGWHKPVLRGPNARPRSRYDSHTSLPHHRVVYAAICI